MPATLGKRLGILALGLGGAGVCAGVAEVIRLRLTLTVEQQMDFAGGDGFFASPLGELAIGCAALALLCLALALVADVVALIGSIDIVLGEVDR